MSGVEKIRDARPWYHDLTELAAFLQWLMDTGQTREPWAVVEKPWHWDGEHDTFLREQEMERLADEQDHERRGAL